MKYKHSRMEVVKKFNNLVAVGAISDKMFCEYLLATKPTKIKKIRRLVGKDTLIDWKITEKINQLVKAVNRLNNL